MLDPVNLGSKPTVRPLKFTDVLLQLLAVFAHLKVFGEPHLVKNERTQQDNSEHQSDQQDPSSDQPPMLRTAASVPPRHLSPLAPRLLPITSHGPHAALDREPRLLTLPQSSGAGYISQHGRSETRSRS